MKVTVILEKSFFTSHIYIQALQVSEKPVGDSSVYFPEIKADQPHNLDQEHNYWINFNSEMRADLPPVSTSGCCHQEFTFYSEKTIEELRKWHQESSFFEAEQYKRCSHNSAHAIRKVLEDFFGYQLKEPSCTCTRINCCLWAPAKLDTPYSVFEAAEYSVQHGIRNLLRKESAELSVQIIKMTP